MKRSRCLCGATGDAKPRQHFLHPSSCFICGYRLRIVLLVSCKGEMRRACPACLHVVCIQAQMKKLLMLGQGSNCWPETSALDSRATTARYSRRGNRRSRLKACEHADMPQHGYSSSRRENRRGVTCGRWCLMTTVSLVRLLHIARQFRFASTSLGRIRRTSQSPS